MTALLPFRRHVFEGTLSRLGSDGEPLIAIAGVTARLTHATPPSPLQALPSAVEGVELGSFELGDPPRLELEVPVSCVNDLLLLFRARKGYRSSDAEAISPALFAELKSKQLDRTDASAALVLRTPAQDRPGHWMDLYLEQVDMTVRALRAEADVIRVVKLGTVVHQDYSREFVPLLGHAGHIAYVPQRGLPE